MKKTFFKSFFLYLSVFALSIAAVLNVNFNSSLTAYADIDRGSTHTIELDETEAVIKWAESYEGKSYFHDGNGALIDAYFNCTAFVRNAYWCNGFSRIATRNARTWGNSWTYSTNLDEVPPRGAITFYDYWKNGINYGHMGISLGDGNVIHATKTVTISDYKCSNFTNIYYTGWGTWRNYNLRTEDEALTTDGCFVPSYNPGTNGSAASFAMSYNRLTGKYITEEEALSVNTSGSANIRWSSVENAYGVKDDVTKMKNKTADEKKALIADIVRNSKSGLILQINANSADGTRFLFCSHTDENNELYFLNPFSPLGGVYYTLDQYCYNNDLTLSITWDRIDTVWTYSI